MKEILFDYLKKQSEVIIYGAGANGRYLNYLLNKNHVRVDYFCDSNEILWGKVIEGTECINPECLKKHCDAVMIVSPVKGEEIKKNLKKYIFKKILDWDDVKFLREKDESIINQILTDVILNDQKLQKALEWNKRYKNIHRGKRCFIIGNGPSLQKEDLSGLADEITFTVNQIARSPQFEAIHTNYHLWADPNFFKMESSCEGDYALLELVKKLPADTECFFRYDCMYECMEKYEISKFINANYYAVSSWVGEQEEIDFSWFICGAYTVVQYAIRLAIYMGIKEIYLLGCDCTAIINAINARLSSYDFRAHCYDIDEKEREREKRMYTEVALQRYYLAEIESLNGYKDLKQYSETRGICIYNCTQGGLLDEFPRRSLSDILAGL